MQKAHVALILGFLVSACAGGEEAAPPPQTPPPAPPPAATQEAPKAEAPKPPPPPGLGELEAATNKALVEALNAHDAKKAASIYAEDAVVTVPGVWINHGQVTGRAEIEKAEQQFFDAFKDVKFWFSRVWVKQDVAALEFGWTGTQSGEFLGTKGGDKQVGAVGCPSSRTTTTGTSSKRTATRISTRFSRRAASSRARPARFRPPSPRPK